MYWFLTDETNFPPEKSAFFIYGGLVIDEARVPELSSRIAAIRAEEKYPMGAPFKFNQDKQVDPETHARAKGKALDAMHDVGAKFMATVVLEQVLRSQTQAQYVSFAMNIMTMAYHQFLVEADGHGAMFIDRVDKREVNAVLVKMADRFMSGLLFPDYTLPVNDRIMLFGMTSNNASHLSSCADIALGTFRYCVNAATGHQKAKPSIAREILPALDRMFWRWEDKPPGERERAGYRPHPKTFVRPWIEDQYDTLNRTLGSYLNE